MTRATRVLVTGATGAFGLPLCTALAARGVEVHAMARRRPTRALPDGVRFVAGDVCDAEAVAAAVAPVDQVVHLAWLVAVSRDARETERINLDGTRNVLQAMRRHGTQRLVFSSSVLAYGAELGHRPYLETDELRPDPVLQYGDHKRIIEEEIAASGIPALVARPAAVVGRHVTGQSAMIFATPALLGVRGEDHPWQFVHQDDVVRFLADGVLDDRTGTVNLAADDRFSLERFGELLGRRAVRVPAAVLRAGIRAMWTLRLADTNPAAMETLRAFPSADTTRLRDDYGFRCVWSSADAVIDTRRAVAGVNLLGSVKLRRRGAPPLPPVGGPDGAAATGRRLPDAVAEALCEGVGRERGGRHLAGELAARAAASAAPMDRKTSATAAAWAETEAGLIQACLGEQGAAQEARTIARLHQRWDASVDVLALAAGAVSPMRDHLTSMAHPLLAQVAASVDERTAQLRQAGALEPEEEGWDLGLADLLTPADALAARRQAGQ